MTLNRTEIPDLKLPGNIPVKKAVKTILDNGLSLYVIDAGYEDVARFDIIFPSGVSGPDDFTVGSACHHLIDSGTTNKKALEIAEGFDYFGAYLQTDFGPDWKSVSLYSLNRFFAETLRCLHEILQEAIYPGDELDTWKVRSIQSLRVNREKVSWLAKTAFNEALFGNNHPYGITSGEKEIESLDAAALIKFYHEQYPLEKATLIVSGKINDQVVKSINGIFGGAFSANSNAVQITNTKTADLAPVKKTIEKADAVQSGIRIGKKLFSKNHPDYQAVQIANTILGGYFGSRLMSNIREDKGYTYGIGSGLHPHFNSGYFYITTEVGKDVRNAALEEIYKELKRLTLEPVPDDELDLVKKYLVGAFQRSLDGPFALADRFRGLHLFHLGYEYLEEYLKLLNSISSDRIMEVAATHLQPENMTEIIAG